MHTLAVYLFLLFLISIVAYKLHYHQGFNKFASNFHNNNQRLNFYNIFKPNYDIHITKKIINNKELINRFYKLFLFASEKSKYKSNNDEFVSTNKFVQPKGPRIQRLYEDSERVQINNLVLGSKLRGRVISITDYGLFVDIGTTKDGLVHIKDVSNDYFITNLQSKFIPGQDIDVWIKFVDMKEKKFGLQMFPLQSNFAANDNDLKLNSDQIQQQGIITKTKIAKNLRELYVTQEIEGKVVKSSEFGVYIDIGMPVLAFLHRRKMKSNRRQRKYKPWEIVPMNSIAKCFVHEVDLRRNRISVTTYEPECWETKLYSTTSYENSKSSDDDDEDDDDDEGMTEDNEELGGDVRAMNLKALRRTLALSLDDEDGEDEDEDDESGEELSEEEIRKLTATGRNAKILIDDFSTNTVAAEDSTNEDSVASNTRTPQIKKNLVTEGVDELSSEELFQHVSNGRPYITLSDLKRWDYMKQLIKDKAIDIPALQMLCKEAGAIQGKLSEDQFELFIDLFAKLLKLDDFDNDNDDDEEDDDDDNNNLEVDEALKPIVTTASPVRTVESKEIRVGGQEISLFDDDTDNDLSFDSLDTYTSNDDEDEDISSPVSKLLVRDKILPSKEMKQHMEKKVSKEEELVPVKNVLSNLFKQLANNKDYIDYSDIMQWDMVKAMIKKDVSYAVHIRQAFSECVQMNKSMKNKAAIGGLTGNTFEVFVNRLSTIEHMHDTADKVDDNSYDEDDDDDDISSSSDDFEELSVDEEFATLSDLNDGEYVTLESVLEWGVVKDLLEEDYITKDQVKDLFMKASLQNTDMLNMSAVDFKVDKQKHWNVVLDIDGFNALLDLLEPYASEGSDDDDDDISTTIGNSKAVANSINTLTTSNSDNSEISDNELLEKAFKGLANGKSFVSLKDIMDWDFVYTLVAEGILTEDILKEKISNLSPANPKGLDFIGFDKFVDEMVVLYKDSDLDDDLPENNEDDFIDNDNKKLSTKIQATNGDDDDDILDDEDLDNDEGEYVDIDTIEAFEKMSKNRGFVTLQDIKNWEMIQEPLSVTGFLDSDWKKVLKTTNIIDENRIDMIGFESILDEVLARTGFYEEDYDEDDDDETLLLDDLNE